MVGYRQISVTCFKAHSRQTKQRSLLNLVNQVLLRITVLTLASVSSERRWSAHQAPVPFLPDVCKHTSIVSFILLMFIIDNGSDVQHGSPTTSHHCSMTFTGYQCHSCAHLALPACYGSMHRISVGNYAFEVSAACICNNLPSDVITPPSLIAFKQQPKTLLFSCSFDLWQSDSCC